MIIKGACQEEDRDLLKASPDAFDSVKADHPWHVDVHHDDVWLELEGQLHRLSRVRGITHDLELNELRELLRERVPKERVIVDEENSNGLHREGSE